MNQNVRTLCKLISVFLQYPDDDLLKTLELAREALNELPRGPASDRCHEFVDYLERTPALRLQEVYTETFDMAAASSLHLTFHSCGDGEARGAALCQWRKIYGEAGYDPADGEMPDYLPMVLELIYVCPGEIGAIILDACHEPVRRISQSLRAMASPYAGILEGLSACLSESGSSPHRSEL
jgi:nitrate reductase molybdenum cofactor assembly chaperone NarJ/NarW